MAKGYILLSVKIIQLKFNSFATCGGVAASEGKKKGEKDISPFLLMERWLQPHAVKNFSLIRSERLYAPNFCRLPWKPSTA
ncbi:MAG: hypothetical protein ABIK28_24390 [Planctomycetota bacterium]